jgi:hypothetical protein
VLLAGLAATGVVSAEIAGSATEESQNLELAEAVSTARTFGEAADLMLRFVQVDGPESGHVRVVLTPETRPLTLLEARSAAEQAFLATLKEPGLGDNLRRITVVVRLMPTSHPDPSGSEQVIVYQHKSGRDWSVLPGE